MMTSIEELPPVVGSSSSGAQAAPIRCFRLSCGDVSVELSSLGASIARILLPNYRDDAESSRDDVVLGYRSPGEQHDDRNRPFFGAIVGRVANRIERGRFELNGEDYRLDCNDGPNHLHGGNDGFCHRIWSADATEDAVRFELVSPDGDQGYPGGIAVVATYTLEPAMGPSGGARLTLKMSARLLPKPAPGEEFRSTPINLAQHTYFNLGGHSSPGRVLDHELRLNCRSYTPVDSTSIPTGEVVDATGAMDFAGGKSLREALVQYGVERAGLDLEAAEENVKIRSPTRVARVPDEGGTPGSNLEAGSPYGFDHNYVVDRPPDCTDSEQIMVATLTHPPSGRVMRVRSTAPGVQVYSKCPHAKTLIQPLVKLILGIMEIMQPPTTLTGTHRPLSIAKTALHTDSGRGSVSRLSATRAQLARRGR